MIRERENPDLSMLDWDHVHLTGKAKAAFVAFVVSAEALLNSVRPSRLRTGTQSYATRSVVLRWTVGTARSRSTSTHLTKRVLAAVIRRSPTRTTRERSRDCGHIHYQTFHSMKHMVFILSRQEALTYGKFNLSYATVLRQLICGAQRTLVCMY